MQLFLLSNLNPFTIPIELEPYHCLYVTRCNIDMELLPASLRLPLPRTHSDTQGKNRIGPISRRLFSKSQTEADPFHQNPN